LTTRPAIHIPILSDILPNGFWFAFGESYLVKFDSSLWYQISLTVTAQALKAGQKTQYHTYANPPAKVANALLDLGVDSEKLARKELFRPIDDYVRLTGLPIQAVDWHTWGEQGTRSPPLNDPAHIDKAIEKTRELLAKGPEEVAKDDKRWLHIDDDASTYYHYYHPSDVWRLMQNSTLPKMRFLENATFHSVNVNSWKQSLYATLEDHCDGVIEIRSKEIDDQRESYLRITTINGKPPNTGWRHIQLSSNGEASLDKKAMKGRDLGIIKWLRGQG
jgi:hypothetical protein